MAESVDANSPAIYQQYLDVIRGAFEDVKKRLAEFDSGHGVSEKASQYLSAAMEKTQAALVELGHVTEQLKAGPAEFPVKALTHALASASAGFSLIQENAKQYDETYKLSSRVSALVANPREQASAALATIAAYAAHASQVANAQLQGLSNQLRAKLAEAASAGLDKALPQALKADEMFHVSERAAATKAVVTQSLVELNEKFGISDYLQGAMDRAQSLDLKITGGKVTPMIAAAYQKGLAMAGAVQNFYEDKKTEMRRAEAPSS